MFLPNRTALRLRCVNNSEQPTVHLYVIKRNRTHVQAMVNRSTEIKFNDYFLLILCVCLDFVIFF